MSSNTITNPGIKFWNLMKKEGIDPHDVLLDLVKSTDILKDVPDGFYRGNETEIYGFLFGLLSGDPFTQPNPGNTFGKVATWLAAKFNDQATASTILAEVLQYEADVADGKPDDSPWMEMPFWKDLMDMNRARFGTNMPLDVWETTISEIRCSFQEGLVRLLIVLFIYQFVEGTGTDEDKGCVQELAKMFREGIQTLMDKGQQLSLIDMIGNVYDHLPQWSSKVLYKLETPDIIQKMHDMTRE